MTDTATFPVKHVRFQDVDVPIIMQTANGPCFLIALVNCIVFKRQTTNNTFQLQPHSLGELDSFVHRLSDSKLIPEVELVNLLGGLVLECETFVEKEAMLKALPGINTGLNLDLNLNNVVVDQFYDLTLPICQLLNMFGITLYHGFILAPDLHFPHTSFDRLQDYMVELTTHDPNNELAPLQSFFQLYPSQLTPFGLDRLADNVSYGEVGIFFRNDHYSTFLKTDSLFVLVTDAGLVDVANVMWQELAINDDSDFLAPDFQKILINDSQLDEIRSGHTEPGNDMDLEMVRKLQNQEDELHAKRLHMELNHQSKDKHPLQQKTPKPSRSTPSKKKSKKCIVM